MRHQASQNALMSVSMLSPSIEMYQAAVDEYASSHDTLDLGGGLHTNQRGLGDDHEEDFSLVEHDSSLLEYANSGQEEKTSLQLDSGFSRHDSLFSFGVSSSRNAEELKSFLGSSSSRLRPGATVLPLQGGAETGNAVSLEQAKPCARVEVDIVLENDCCVEGGYLRGTVKLRVRRRRKEAHVLLADGKLRVIGFESIPGESNRHCFYQRASPLCAATDAYNRIYDSPADSEGFSRASEGVHVLPFAMHLPADSHLGSARGSPCVQNGVTLRYIAMISVKVKDSKTGKRSIAHFYRDCQVWPRMDPAVVLANSQRPIQASTVGSFAVLGAGGKVRLTAMLPRITWLAGQRCYVHLSVTNESKKSVKTVKLALIRTTTLFKSRSGLKLDNTYSGDPAPCQATTAHKVVAEAVLERSQTVAKGHASAPGWWTGVSAGQDAQFAHYILINSDALSVPRARFFEVEYSIQVTLSAGTLTSDVQVTLPIRVVNFLSLDPLPSAPLLSKDGSYARIIPRDVVGENHPSCVNLSVNQDVKENAIGPHSDDDTRLRLKDSSTFPGLKLSHEHSVSGARGQVGCSNANASEEDFTSTPSVAALHVTNPDLSAHGFSRSEAHECSELPYESASDTSLYSTASYPTNPGADLASSATPESSSALPLGNLELFDESDMRGEVDVVLQSLTPTHTSAAVVPSEDGIHERMSDSVRYSQTGNISTAGSSATPPNSSHRASTSSASLRSSHACFEPHRRRGCSHTNPVMKNPFLPPRDEGTTDRAVVSNTVGAAVSGVDCCQARPVRPERSPLRTRTGTWGPRQQETAHEAMSSFERRVQEKKTALLAAQPGPPPTAPVHLHEFSQSGTEGECRRYTADVYGEGDDTPRIGASARILSAGATTTPDSFAAESASRIRASRQLPLPPPRLSQISQGSCDIPSSVSALEALRASQLCSREPPPGSTNSGFLSDASADTPTLSSATTKHPAIPPLMAASTSSSSSSDRSTSYGQQDAFPPSISGLGLYHHHRPTEGLRSTGSSDSSIVKGRIAAFEERLKSSQGLGAAYM
ncbi:hypothetical protein BC628DRAFT_1354600 [Trametes gibbosa]|nr:hypothetical protein BC628DRAFT_1354600 [Trametes gibbosa]